MYQLSVAVVVVVAVKIDCLIDSCRKCRLNLAGFVGTGLVG